LKDGDYLGYCIAKYSARSTDIAKLETSQDGGVTRELIQYALEKGYVDGFVIGIRDGSKISPKVITEPEEVKFAGGTVFAVCPIVSEVKNAVREYGLEKVGVVGVPCQIQAIRKLQLYPAGGRAIPEKIVLTIGIFCKENFPYDGLKTIVEYYCKTKMENVKKMIIRHGKFWVESENGKNEIPLSKTLPYYMKGCNLCIDYTAELADISTGSLGTPTGWNTVFLRTEKGKNLFDSALKDGRIEAKDISEVKPGERAIIKIAKEKYERALDTFKEREKLKLQVYLLLIFLIKFKYYTENLFFDECRNED